MMPCPVSWNIISMSLRHAFRKKLCRLYGGWIPLSKPPAGFVNLSSKQLSDDQKDFLSLGINQKVAPKYDQIHKKAELELLYQDVISLRDQRKINVNPDIKEQLMSESTKNRSRPGRRSLSPRLLRAAKELKDDPDIQIRKADKSNTYVLLDKSEYLSKMDDILADDSKFTPISRNPIDELKRSANNLIEAANKATGANTFSRIVGEFQPGYMYGNVKTHKLGNPLRPIISQIPLPTYNLAKQLNSILISYVPDTYSLKSPSEFVDLIRTRKPNGMLASLDVSNLFTNVPVEQTITVLCDMAYRNPTLAPPVVPERVMTAMLRLCTSKAPFRSPRGALFYQTDGVAMGSPLGVLFAQAYMGWVENKVLAHNPPQMYCRYIDDIITEVRDRNSLQVLKSRLERESCLKFTVEESVENKINFLDVSINASGDSFITSVYRKPTDSGNCLSARSDCPERYKKSVVTAYVRRALTHCSSWPLVTKELQHIKQMLSNNHYSASMVDSQIRHTLEQYMQTIPTPNASNGTTHTLYYKNIMNPGWKTDEKVLHKIIKNNCIPTSDQDSIKLNIYYRTPTTANMIMSNNPNRDHTTLRQANIVYFYKCNKGDCALLPRSGYVGLTTTSLSRRITMHLQAGGPRTHNDRHHDSPLTRKDMTDNTRILATACDRRRLPVLEAVFIRELGPCINLQVNARGTLQLYDGPLLTNV